MDHRRHWPTSKPSARHRCPLIHGILLPESTIHAEARPPNSLNCSLQLQECVHSDGANHNSAPSYSQKFNVQNKTMCIPIHQLPLKCTQKFEISLHSVPSKHLTKRSHNRPHVGHAIHQAQIQIQNFKRPIHPHSTCQRLTSRCSA